MIINVNRIRSGQSFSLRKAMCDTLPSVSGGDRFRLVTRYGCRIPRVTTGFMVNSCRLYGKWESQHYNHADFMENERVDIMFLWITCVNLFCLLGEGIVRCKKNGLTPVKVPTSKYVYLFVARAWNYILDRMYVHDKVCGRSKTGHRQTPSLFGETTVTRYGGRPSFL